MMRKYWPLFTLGLWLGSTVFGGVNAAYPIIRQKAEELGWMTGEEVDGAYALSVFLPGPSFLNLWGAVSVRVGGLPGAVIAQVGLLLPAFALVICLPLLAHIPWVGARTDGAMLGAVYATAGLLIATGMEGLKRWKETWHKSLGLAMLLLIFLGVHPLLLLLGGALIGAGRSARLIRKEAA
ncbi:MAG: chromate transporter [Bacillota bacterium]